MLLRVLIADDEPIEHKVLSKIISDTKLPAVVVGMARSGTEALEMFERCLPDLVFMDIRMPGMNGLDVSAAIKQEHAKTQIAIITAYNEFEYAKRAIDIHADYFLLKPVEPAEVERILRETLPRTNDRADDPFLRKISPSRANLAQSIANLLHRHYMEPITLAWLETRLNASHQYLNRTFKEAYNTTIMNYLSHFRIAMAKRLMSDPGLSISAVAERVGIPDASYFGQLFKQVLGVTPSQYRKLQIRESLPGMEPQIFSDGQGHLAAE